MGGLIEFFLSNPILLILIIGGLASWFKRREGQDDSERTKPYPKPRPTLNRAELPKIPTPTRDIRTAKPAPTGQEYSERGVEEQPNIEREPVIEKVEPVTVEAQYDHQLDDLKKQLGVVDERERPRYSELRKHKQERQTTKTPTVTQHQFKKRFKQNVSPSGLVHSVIMAEVLGPPRALKPYESIRERYRKT